MLRYVHCVLRVICAVQHITRRLRVTCRAWKCSPSQGGSALPTARALVWSACRAPTDKVCFLFFFSLQSTQGAALTLIKISGRLLVSSGIFWSLEISCIKQFEVVQASRLWCEKFHPLFFFPTKQKLCLAAKCCIFRFFSSSPVLLNVKLWISLLFAH